MQTQIRAAFWKGVREGSITELSAEEDIFDVIWEHSREYINSLARAEIWYFRRAAYDFAYNIANEH